MTDENVVVDDGQTYVSEETAIVATEAAAQAKQWAEESERQANIATDNADSAVTAKDNAQIWAEGTDGQVQTLGGVHSAKGWAETLAHSALVLNVKDYGAKGDGVTNDSNAFQAAFNDAHSKGGAIIFVPEGTYLVSGARTYEHTNIKGVFGKTVIKRPNNDDNYIFRSAYIYTDNVFDYVSLEDVIFDGNKSNALGQEAKSLIAYYKVRYFYARNCIFRNSLGYGLGLQAYPNGAIVGTQSYVYMENCYFLNNGDGVTDDTMDGLDIKYCDNITLVGCTANDNKDNGINVRGVNVSIVGCKAANNLNNGFALQGNAGGALPATINVSGCFSLSNSGHGYVVWNGGNTGSKVDVIISNSQAKSNLNGICISDCSEVRTIINDCMLVSNTRNGFYITDDATSCSVANIMCIANKNGININANNCTVNDVYCISNSEYGVVFGSRTHGNNIGGSSRIAGNTLGNFNFNGTDRNAIGSDVMEGNRKAAIASASTITLPQAYNLFVISGTEQIKTINASPYGRMVTLTFQSTASIKSGAGNVYICGDFNATSGNCMITLISDGSKWFEVSRKNASGARVVVGVDAPVSLSDSVLISKGEYVKPLNSYDNIINLGASNARWKEVFAGTGTINTSDERQKQNIEDIDEAVFRAWEKVDFKQFLFSDAVEKKGENARIHIGLIAQRVKAAFDSEGLDGFKYGLLCYDEWEEEKDEAGNVINPAGNAYGIRYSEALALECAYQRWKLGQMQKQLDNILNKDYSDNGLTL